MALTTVARDTLKLPASSPTVGSCCPGWYCPAVIRSAITR